MDLFKEFINSYGVTILYAVITGICGYIGIVIKNLYKIYVDDRTKKSVVKTCVQAVEQIYKDLHGQEKFDMCVEYVSQMLENKGIIITAIEIQMLIEAAVKEMNDKAKPEEGEEEAPVEEPAEEEIIIEEEAGE